MKMKVKKDEVMYKNKDSTNYKRQGRTKIMNIVKQDNVIREIKSLPKVEKELLEYEFIDRNPSRVYVLDTDEEYFLSSLLSVLDNNKLNDTKKIRMIRENILAIQSSFALELYIPFNAIKIYTEYYVTNYKDQEKK